MNGGSSADGVGMAAAAAGVAAAAAAVGFQPATPPSPAAAPAAQPVVAPAVQPAAPPPAAQLTHRTSSLASATSAGDGFMSARSCGSYAWGEPPAQGSSSGLLSSHPLSARSSMLAADTEGEEWHTAGGAPPGPPAVRGGAAAAAEAGAAADEVGEGEAGAGKAVAAADEVVLVMQPLTPGRRPGIGSQKAGAPLVHVEDGAPDRQPGCGCQCAIM